MMRNDQAPRARRAVVAACALLAVLNGSLAYAHSDEYFDTRPSAHGGQTRMAGPVHIELVRSGTAVTLYITDHADQPQATAAGKARLRIEGSDVQVQLAPAGDNRFTGTLPDTVAADTPIVAFVQLAGGDAQTARFGPKASAPHGDAHDHAEMHGDAHGHKHTGPAHEGTPASPHTSPDEAHAHEH